MDYQELIDDLKGRINLQYADCTGTESYERKQCLDAIESLLAENERLKAECDEWEANSKQWEQEYYKKDTELAKYRDAPVVVWRTHPFDYGIGHEGVYASTHFKEQSEVWKRKGWRVEELIIKPGENK